MWFIFLFFVFYFCILIHFCQEKSKIRPLKDTIQKLFKLFTAVAAVNVTTRSIEETVSKLVYEKKLKKATAKKETEAKKTIELQKSMERYVKEKSSTKSIKKNPLVVSAKPPPAPIKDDPTGERERITFFSSNTIYRIFSYSFRGNYSFLNLEILEISISCHKFQFLT